MQTKFKDLAYKKGEGVKNPKVNILDVIHGSPLGQLAKSVVCGLARIVGSRPAEIIRGR